MNIFEKLYRWRNHFRHQGGEPTFVPLTSEELTVVVSDCPYVGQSQRFMDPPPVQFANAFAGNKLFGTDIFDSPFALEMRYRQVSLPVTQLEESAEISTYRESRSEDRARDIIRRRLTAHICSDTTRLDLTFEWDPLAKFKRALRITKWFPVKTRTVRIDGRVLYPYLKIALPHNRHHATFKHVQ